jgi:hypothetical protein
MAQLLEVPVEELHLPLHERRYPFRAANEAEQREINKRIGIVLEGIEDMLFELAREIAPRGFCRDDHEELVQRTRVHLWQYSLPRYDGRRKPSVKVSTFVFYCAGRFMRCAAASMLLKFERELRRCYGEGFDELQLESYSPDRLAHIADSIHADPLRFGFTPAEGRAIQGMATQHPDESKREIAQRLGYRHQSNFSNKIKTIQWHLASFDILDVATR